MQGTGLPPVNLTSSDWIPALCEQVEDKAAVCKGTGSAGLIWFKIPGLVYIFANWCLLCAGGPVYCGSLNLLAILGVQDVWCCESDLRKFGAQSLEGLRKKRGKKRKRSIPVNISAPLLISYLSRHNLVIWIFMMLCIHLLVSQYILELKELNAGNVLLLLF